MAIAARLAAASLDVVRADETGPVGPATTREVDVDDVRALLKELRLRRQLRADD